MTTRKTFLVSTHLYLRKDDTILLYLRKWWNQDMMYNLIAWHLDWWEDPKNATIREAYEEAGITIKKEDLIFETVAYSMTWKWQEYIQFYFSCDKWDWEIKNMEQDRCYEMKFFLINNLPKNISPYIKKAINDYKNWEKYGEYL